MNRGMPADDQTGFDVLRWLDLGAAVDSGTDDGGTALGETDL